MVSNKDFFEILHLYYKLAYIKVAWGGPEEQAAEIEGGNSYAKDWQDEARKIVEKTVSCSLHEITMLIIQNQMAEYYQDRPLTPPQQEKNRSHIDEAISTSPLSEYDKVRETLLTTNVEEGWSSELRCYLGTMQRDVTKDTDLIEWWQVSRYPSFFYTKPAC